MKDKQISIIKKALKKSRTYTQYREWANELITQGKTTGTNHSEEMLRYTRLNIGRMNKWDKHYQPQQDTLTLLSQMEEKELWILITEAWCGDAAHSLPIISKLAGQTEQIDLKIVLRDENLQLMDMFLTNGGRSIPKLIRLRPHTLKVLGTWGPRPEALQELRKNLIAQNIEKSEVSNAIQIWYARDRGISAEHELAAMLAKLVAY